MEEKALNEELKEEMSDSKDCNQTEDADTSKANEANEEDVADVAEEVTEEITEETVEEEDTQEDQTETEKKDRRKKKEKKDKRDEQIAELTDRVKRQLAEFENFRNRSEKEKSAMYEMGAKAVIEKMLPVLDNFERGIAAISEEDKDTPMSTGMQMIYKQMITELENIGVKPIEAVGKEFDPNFHNAVMQSESDEYESGIVDKELQKGYMYHDSVVRHSCVSVVQ